MKKNLIFKYGGLLLILIILVTGCGKQSKSQTSPSTSTQNEQTGEKIPEQLKALEESIENIMQAFNAPAVSLADEKSKSAKSSSGQESTQKESTQKESTQKESTQKESTQKESTQKESTQKESTQKESTQKESTQKGQSSSQSESTKQKGGQEADQGTKTEDPMQKVSVIINTLHLEWNSYMPLAAKSGANKTLLDNFSNALNNLTNTLTGKNKNSITLAANMLYLYIPDFYSLYKTNTSSDIKRLRYSIRSAILNASILNWSIVDTDLNNIKSTWALYKNTLGKEQQDNSSKLDLSIYEFEKVIKERNQILCDIKGRIALSNVEAIEKDQAKASSQQSK